MQKENDVHDRYMDFGYLCEAVSIVDLTSAEDLPKQQDHKRAIAEINTAQEFQWPMSNRKIPMAITV